MINLDMKVAFTSPIAPPVSPCIPVTPANVESDGCVSAAAATRFPAVSPIRLPSMDTVWSELFSPSATAIRSPSAGPRRLSEILSVVSVPFPATSDETCDASSSHTFSSERCST